MLTLRKLSVTAITALLNRVVLRVPLTAFSGSRHRFKYPNVLRFVLAGINDYRYPIIKPFEFEPDQKF